MTAIEELYLLEVERARDRDRPAHPYDTHCLCYACEDRRADLQEAYEDRRAQSQWQFDNGGFWPDEEV